MIGGWVGGWLGCSLDSREFRWPIRCGMLVDDVGSWVMINDQVDHCSNWRGDEEINKVGVGCRSLLGLGNNG